MRWVHVALLLGVLVSSPGCGEDESSDAIPDMLDASAETDSVDVPRLEVGFHPPDANAGMTPPGEGTAPDLSEFTIVEDGVQLPVHFGNQGSSMVVLGIQTQGFSEPVLVDISLEVNGDPLASLRLEQLTFTTSDGGWSYLFNLFVAFDGCAMFDEGSPGVLSVTTRDGTGSVVTRSYQVTMGANDFCFGDAQEMEDLSPFPAGSQDFGPPQTPCSAPRTTTTTPS